MTADDRLKAFHQIIFLHIYRYIHKQTHAAPRTHARMHACMAMTTDTEAQPVCCFWRSNICVNIPYFLYKHTTIYRCTSVYVLYCPCIYCTMYTCHRNERSAMKNKCELNVGEEFCPIRAWICWRVTNIAANKYRSLSLCVCIYGVCACKHTITIILNTSGDQLQNLKVIVFVQNSTPTGISIVWVFFCSQRIK